MNGSKDVQLTASQYKTMAGWLPAVILPSAALNQLYSALVAENVSGVSLTAWVLFLVANLGSLVFAPKNDRVVRLQVFLAFGLTSLAECGIIFVLLTRT